MKKMEKKENRKDHHICDNKDCSWQSWRRCHCDQKIQINNKGQCANYDQQFTGLTEEREMCDRASHRDRTRPSGRDSGMISHGIEI